MLVISLCSLRPQMSLLVLLSPACESQFPPRRESEHIGKSLCKLLIPSFCGASVFPLLRLFATTALILKTRSSTPEGAVCVTRCFLT